MSEQINCPVCGKPEDQGANYCANCGEHLGLADQANVTKYKSPAIKYFIAAAIVLIAILAISQSGVSKQSGDIPPGYVKISVKLYQTELTVSNASDFDLNDVEIILNPDSTMKGYSHKVDVIKADDTVVTHVSEFTKKSGGRFSPLVASLTDVVIKCDTPKGPVIWESNGDLEIVE